MADCHVDDDENKNLEWKYAFMLHCCFVWGMSFVINHIVSEKMLALGWWKWINDKTLCGCDLCGP
jgi:hypothetical protein